MGNAKKAVFHLVGVISPDLESSDEKKYFFKTCHQILNFSDGSELYMKRSFLHQHNYLCVSVYASSWLRGASPVTGLLNGTKILWL